MPEVKIAQSDCIEVTNSLDDTIKIDYSNQHDFAGMIYDPDKPVFTIRVPGKFYHERFPEENESSELSDNSIVKLSGSVKSQRQLQTNAMPYFMHYKLKLILQHNYILIDSKTWEKEEVYDVKKLHEKNQLSMGETFLTEKEDNYFINVFGEV